jgi:hypothetical protein
MNVVGVGRLSDVDIDAVRQRLLAVWLAELREARMRDMVDITKRFASAKPTGAAAADFFVGDELLVRALFSFPARTMLIRSVALMPKGKA